MDYEKKYNDALERAKAYHRNELAGSKKEMMEYIFPELAESEDERIRRTLVEYFGPKVQLDFVRGVPIQKIRDWLEKHKEPENTSASTMVPSCWEVEQKEQKPAWSEDIIRKAIKEVGLTQHQIDWFKTNVFPPKQEWSEEEEQMFGNILNHYSSIEAPTDGNGISKERYLAFIKSLRPQHREEIYHAAKHDLAIKFMNYLDENRPEGKMCLSNGECEDIDKAFKENDWAKIMRYVETYSPQPKVAWSEKDERILKGIIGKIDHDQTYGVSKDEMLNLLKKL